MKTLREFALFVNQAASPISVQNLASGNALPISLRDLLGQKLIFQLSLERLTCHKTESFLSSDNCRLEIFTDGSLEFPLRRSLNHEQFWDISRTYLFTQQVTLKLWDEDSPDPDDRLGTATISVTSINHATAQFKEDGASYTLQYSVSPLLIPQEFDLVQQEITLFEQSTSAGKWSHIPKAELIADIRKTIANPFNVQQVNTPLCGPAAIVFELVRKQPKRYVQICRQLWETGKFQARTETIEPSDTLLNSSVKGEGNKISLADWMLMTALRDTANLIFDVDSNSGNFVMGLALPGEMRGWTFELLGYDTVDFISTYTFGEIDAMQTAQKLWVAGGVAFLMIDADLLHNKAAGIIPNHWIVFLGGLTLNNISDELNFQCYSWGNTFSVSKKQDDFEDYLFGVVTGI